MQARFSVAPQTAAAPQSPQPAGGERTAKAAQQFDAAIGVAKAAYDAQPKPAGESAKMPHGETAHSAASRSDGSAADAHVDAVKSGEAAAVASQPAARGQSPRNASATDSASRQRRAQSQTPKSTEATAIAAPTGDVPDAAAAASESNPSPAPIDGSPAAAVLNAAQTGLPQSIVLPTATPPDSQSQDPSVQAGLEQSVAGRRGSFEHPPTAPITGPEVAADDATVQPPLAGAAAPAPGRSAPRGDFRALADRSGEARPTHAPADHGPSATATPSPLGPESRSPGEPRRRRHRHTKRPLLSHRLSRQRSLARRSHWTPHPLCRCPVCRLHQAHRILRRLPLRRRRWHLYWCRSGIRRTARRS